MPKQSQKPTISIVLPTYKRPDRLRSALHSICRQTYTQYEVIVVDDNSDPDIARASKIVAEEFTKQISITYIKTKKNLGGALARNEGIKAAKGEFIAFLDDDDLWSDTKLAKQIALFSASADPKLALVYCRAAVVNEKGEVIEYSRVHARGDVFKIQLLSDGLARTPALLIKRDVLLEVGGFRKLVSRQEYDLLLRIFELGYKADYVDEVLMTAVIHKEERISTREKKIEGEEFCLELRSSYFDRITSEEKSALLYAHHSKMADLLIMLKSDYLHALGHLRMALKERPFSLASYGKIILAATRTYALIRRASFVYKALKNRGRQK